MGFAGFGTKTPPKPPPITGVGGMLGMGGGMGGGGGTNMIGSWGPNGPTTVSASGGSGMLGMTNLSAAPNPFMTGIFDMMKERYGQGFELPPELGAELGGDLTKQRVAQAQGLVNDQTAGARARAAEQAARSGGDSAPIGSITRGIDEAGQRRKAGVTADVTNSEAEAKRGLAVTAGNMRMGWEQGRNALLGAAGGLAGGIAGNQLGASSLALQAQTAQQQAAADQTRQMLGLWSTLYSA